MLDAVPVGTSDRRFRLFAVGCFAIYREQFRPKRLRKTVRIGERYADGEVTDVDLRRAAWSAQATAGERTLRDGVQSDSESTPREWFVRALVRAAVSVSAEDVVRSSLRLPSFGRLEDEAHLFRDIFGNPFRPVIFDPSWRTSTVLVLARGIYTDRAFDRLPILADALQDAGCDDPDILGHCRGPGPHVRGCWVVDLVLGLS
jgi:hypothetical protein